jgi:glycerol transport system ATP-binding protein
MLRIQNVLLNSRQSRSFAHDFLPGKMTVVLGRNQSGKTNLCRLIAGLATQATGDLYLDDQLINKVAPQHRSVGVVFQAFVNYPNWTVARNIASPMIAAGRDKPYVLERVNELAEKLGIGEFLQRMPDELSGGQQQRLAIARALAKEGKVLLLDEPLVNLDYKLREALALELRGLLNDTDTTVIYTTTDPKDAFTLGDELVLLEQGEKNSVGQSIVGISRAAESFSCTFDERPERKYFCLA